MELFTRNEDPKKQFFLFLLTFGEKVYFSTKPTGIRLTACDVYLMSSIVRQYKNCVRKQLNIKMEVNPSFSK